MRKPVEKSQKIVGKTFPDKFSTVGIVIRIVSSRKPFPHGKSHTIGINDFPTENSNQFSPD